MDCVEVLHDRLPHDWRHPGLKVCRIRSFPVATFLSSFPCASACRCVFSEGNQSGVSTVSISFFLALLELYGVKHDSDEELCVSLRGTPGEVAKTLEGLVAREPEPLKVAELVAAEATRKSDKFLGEKLLRISCSREILDIPGAHEVTRRVLEKWESTSP